MTTKKAPIAALFLTLAIYSSAYAVDPDDTTPPPMSKIEEVAPPSTMPRIEVPDLGFKEMAKIPESGPDPVPPTLPPELATIKDFYDIDTRRKDEDGYGMLPPGHTNETLEKVVNDNLRTIGELPEKYAKEQQLMQVELRDLESKSQSLKTLLDKETDQKTRTLLANKYLDAKAEATKAKKLLESGKYENLADVDLRKHDGEVIKNRILSDMDQAWKQRGNPDADKKFADLQRQFDALSVKGDSGFLFQVPKNLHKLIQGGNYYDAAKLIELANQVKWPLGISEAQQKAIMGYAKAGNAMDRVFALKALTSSGLTADPTAASQFSSPRDPEKWIRADYEKFNQLRGANSLNGSSSESSQNTPPSKRGDLESSGSQGLVVKQGDGNQPVSYSGQNYYRTTFANPNGAKCNGFSCFNFDQNASTGEVTVWGRKTEDYKIPSDTNLGTMPRNLPIRRAYRVN